LIGLLVKIISYNIKMVKSEDIKKLLDKLSMSSFRSKFHLVGKELEMVDKKGLPLIRQHARDLILKKLAATKPIKDGKQTPYRGHPVFIAQHATATCCRTCLFKWHRIPKGKELSAQEIEYIVDVIESWLIQDRHGYILD
jgi:hypothetical protein